MWHNYLRRAQEVNIYLHLNVTLYLYFLSFYIRFSFLQATPGLYILSFEANKFFTVPSPRSIWYLTLKSLN